MYKLKKIKKLIFLFIPFFLIGCTSMNSKFACPNKPGVNCRSLDQVNDMVDRGLIGRQEVYKTKSSSEAYVAMQNINKQALATQFSGLRMGEQVVRIWIAPYQDVNNNYHNESTIYTVVRKNNWAVPKEISE